MQWLRLLTFPFALLYGGIVKIRNYLYDINFLKSNTFSTPTICIGNLSVGGTGKTPMTDFLITHLKAHFTIAVLSRGYKRKSSGFILAGEKTSVLDLGDEPFQLFKKHKELIVAVDADRSNGISEIQKKTTANFILLDDAFQHRKVNPHYSILLTTFEQPFFSDFYLPMGNLRDDKNQKKRANVIVVTKCPADLSQTQQTQYIEKIKPKASQKVVFSTLKYAEVLKGVETDLTFSAIKDKKLALLTGIANPKPLVEFLHNNDLHFRHFKYADHHFFTMAELNKLANFDVVITTEKDFVRLDSKLPNAYYLGVEHHFINQEPNLVSLLLDTFKTDSAF
ncbi:tetraacyldisaccharide 4'-kinase [Croceivirga lutea]|uniref:tetraacyldisaccharide 4'-kinase n=1 Tax=Croceivirga lutea TaxID=1775167 RepID=UPI001639DBEB|nr:tetraacyldisaccharide 4'-kinase [Croceivirga lutea]GGG52723.1 tetraacyldisaccharide 4'-kinase [Croceivirga lutea]